MRRTRDRSTLQLDVPAVDQGALDVDDRLILSAPQGTRHVQGRALRVLAAYRRIEAIIGLHAGNLEVHLGAVGHGVRPSLLGRFGRGKPPRVARGEA